MKTEATRARRGFSPWLEWGRDELAFLGKREAQRECEKILETLFRVSRLELYLAREADPSVFPQFAAWVQARKKRIPLAYLVGKVPFWEDEFTVEEGVFIPRPETETLVDAFLTKSGFSRSDSFSFLDLGTGTGNLGLTLAKLFPRSRGILSDLSSQASALSARNAERFGVEDRLEGVQADGLLSFRESAFDVILSNPPYVASKDWEGLEPEVRSEPRRALVAGEEGLDFYRRIFRELSCLKKGGSLWVEIGWGQAEKVRPLFDRAGFGTIEIFKDLNSIERVMGGIDFHG